MGRSVCSALVTMFAVGLAGALVTVGCSADGTGGDFVNEPSAATPGSNDAQLPPPSQEEDASVTPTPPLPDAGPKPEKDAGPPPPDPGDPCTTVDEIVQRSCGMCGKQAAICETTDDGLKWSGYDQCKGETGVCVAGDERACGNCGTQKCSTFCSWQACGGEPASACTPGSVELVSAGCPDDAFRQRSCANTCSYDGNLSSCMAPPTLVKVPPTASKVNSTIVLLSGAKTIKRPVNRTSKFASATTSTALPACADAANFATLGNTEVTPIVPSETVPTPYNYIVVQNPNDKAAKVTIYTSQVTGGKIARTVLAAYNGNTAPVTDAARRNCLKGFKATGTTALGGTTMAALNGAAYETTIPAGGVVSVYVASFNAFEADKPELSTGQVRLNVMLEALEE
jgi:hypothetical protein